LRTFTLKFLFGSLFMFLTAGQVCAQQEVLPQEPLKQDAVLQEDKEDWNINYDDFNAFGAGPSAKEIRSKERKEKVYKKSIEDRRRDFINKVKDTRRKSDLRMKKAGQKEKLRKRVSEKTYKHNYNREKRNDLKRLMRQAEIERRIRKQ